MTLPSALDMYAVAIQVLIEEDPACFEWDEIEPTPYANMASEVLAILSSGAGLGELKHHIRRACDLVSARHLPNQEARIVRSARRLLLEWERAGGLVRTCTTEQDEDAFVASVFDLLDLQNLLVNELDRVAGGHLPGKLDSGVLSIDEVKWSYWRHGSGFTFESLESGALINAHDVRPGRSTFVDAGMIVQYLDSLLIARVCAFGAECDVGVECVGLLLERLVASAVLERVPLEGRGALRYCRRGGTN